MYAEIMPTESVWGLRRGKRILLFEKGRRIWAYSGRDDKKWRAFCRLILKERGAKCSICGKIKGDPASGVDDTIIQIHHMKPVSKFPALLFDKSNCVVLCKVCHNKEHGRR